jgi:tRNA A58 N-methylase Trm61
MALEPVAMTSAGTTPCTHEYERGHSDWELERLRRQAELVDPFTLQFYHNAGISKGMRVLRVGSGARDTALLLAELVGDDGLVVGVDRAPAAVALTDLPDEAFRAATRSQ